MKLSFQSTTLAWRYVRSRTKEDRAKRNRQSRRKRRSCGRLRRLSRHSPGYSGRPRRHRSRNWNKVGVQLIFKTYLEMTKLPEPEDD
jgi:hypothetical protein